MLLAVVHGFVSPLYVGRCARVRVQTNLVVWDIIYYWSIRERAVSVAECGELNSIWQLRSRAELWSLSKYRRPFYTFSSTPFLSSCFYCSVLCFFARCRHLTLKTETKTTTIVSELYLKLNCRIIYTCCRCVLRSCYKTEKQRMQCSVTVSKSSDVSNRIQFSTIYYLISEFFISILSEGICKLTFYRIHYVKSSLHTTSYRETEKVADQVNEYRVTNF